MAYEHEYTEWRAAVADLTEFDYAAYEADFDPDERAGQVGGYMDVGVLCRELERDAQRRRGAVA